ncbi:unnamed protein product, partial [Meganyctiphanes norvegica]
WIDSDRDLPTCRLVGGTRDDENGSSGCASRPNVEGGISSREYCNSFNKSDCNSHKWPHPDYYESPRRHPYWCGLSVAFTLGPSLLTNVILLISLLYKFNYKRHFMTA